MGELYRFPTRRDHRLNGSRETVALALRQEQPRPAKHGDLLLNRLSAIVATLEARAGRGDVDQRQVVSAKLLQRNVIKFRQPGQLVDGRLASTDLPLGN